jgi:hypothetical protein
MLDQSINHGQEMFEPDQKAEVKAMAIAIARTKSAVQ